MVWCDWSLLFFFYYYFFCSGCWAGLGLKSLSLSIAELDDGAAGAVFSES